MFSKGIQEKQEFQTTHVDLDLCEHSFFYIRLDSLRISIAEWMSIKNATFHRCMQLVGWLFIWN